MNRLKMLPRVPSNSAVENTAVRFVNWVLTRFTSAEYQAFLDGLIQYGFAAAKRDTEEGREPPTDWR
ncbi:hypothetical protein ABZX73_06395 [Brevibacterium casei]|uniref:hypothetical protein n=1 Tax=Brevibacterium sanguinis TaxID=232444 RepID=UPI0031E11E84